MITIFFVLIYMIILMSLLCVGYKLACNRKIKKIIIRLVHVAQNMYCNLMYKDEIDEWKAMKRDVVKIKFKREMKKLA